MPIANTFFTFEEGDITQHIRLDGITQVQQHADHLHVVLADGGKIKVSKPEDVSNLLSMLGLIVPPSTVPAKKPGFL